MTQPSDKLLAELLLEIKKLNTAIANLQKQPSILSTEQWVVGSDACQLLKPEGIRSISHLKRLRRDGVFSELQGEIRNVSRGLRPTWEYNIPRCRVALKRYFDSLSA